MPKTRHSNSNGKPQTGRARKRPPEPRQQFAIVGIGASAGGLEACNDLLAHLPNPAGMAFVIVQHLDPRHESTLPELLSRTTRIPVSQVSRNTRVKPDHIYVIPPDASLLIRNGILRLEPRPAGLEGHRLIDRFFISLAEDRRSGAIGVILSGNAGDGTLGLMAIKSKGGITFAQDETARFESMPRSAIAAGAVDFVLPPSRIARQLAALGRHPSPGSVCPERGQTEDPAFVGILNLLRDHGGVDFSNYGRETVCRRIIRRMVLEKCENLRQYLELLERRPECVAALFEDMLVTVTEFFRDPPVLEALKSVVFPSLLQGRPLEDVIRIWVPGCATGEEVFSIAIALTEYLEDTHRNRPFQIFGTDVNDTSIAKARVGTYSGSVVHNVSPGRLRRFFQRVDSGYEISRALRKSCVFSRQNVVSDAPLGRMDLISCRGLLPYFEPKLQARLVQVFRHALKPGGCLVLGLSEQPPALEEAFTALDREHGIYCPKSKDRKPAFALPAHAVSVPLAAPSETSMPPRDTVQAYADRMLVRQYAPSGLLVDPDLRVVRVLGDVESYLGANRDNPDLLPKLSEQLRLQLRGAVEKAAGTTAGMRLQGIRLGHGGRSRLADIFVMPVKPPGAAPHFLILFEELRSGKAERAHVRARPSRSESAAQIRAELLRDELESTRTYLQSIIEELRTANEEIQSSNEEFLGTNEELQAAQEELQSSNEELFTINEEMEGRNKELRQANNDLLNLLSSMRIPILMLSDDLRIRRYTPASEQILHLLATDIGRPITDLEPRIKLPNLAQAVIDVIHGLTPYEQETQDSDGRWYVLRIRPYRTAENRIEGAVLQLLDIDQLKRSLEEARQARDYAEGVIDTIWEPLLVLDHRLCVLTANPSFYQTFGLEPGSALGRGIFEIGAGQWDFPRMRALLDEMLRSRNHARDLEIEHTFDRIGPRVLQLNARRIEQDGDTGLILLALQDITDRALAAEARYRRLFESAQDAIVIVDAASGEVTDVNPSALALFGYSREELLGRNLLDIDSLADVPGANTLLGDVRSRGVVRYPDWPLLSKDGRNLSVEVIGNAYREANRGMIQFNIRDNTQRKRFEMQLQHTQKLESLGLLAGGIAHDFNNLLTGIMGNASLGMVEAHPEGSARKYFREIIRSSERAADLTRQMLAYAGKGRFIVKPLNVSDLIRDTGTLIRTSIPKQVDLRFDLGCELPRVEGDSAQLQQLVMNLVINGAEAIGDQPGSLTVRTSAREVGADFVQEYPPGEPIAPGQYVCVEVADTGMGMDEPTKARIFDPFFTTKFTGRGLGLAAAVGIVRSHKGAMRVFSTPGLGSTFEVYLPASAAAVPGKQPQVLEKLRGSGTILFVDDEELLRGLARNALEFYGYKVLLAENGKVAVDLFRENPDQVNLVILDMTMPVMGGRAALDRLKGIRPDVPVILSSGYDQSEAAAKFAGQDLAGFVQKPYPVETLLQRIAEVLRPGRART